MLDGLGTHRSEIIGQECSGRMRPLRTSSQKVRPTVKRARPLTPTERVAALRLHKTRPGHDGGGGEGGEGGGEGGEGGGEGGLAP